MKTEKALRNLRLAIYAPIVIGLLLFALDFMGQTSGLLPDFNRLFSMLTPMQTVGGLLLVFGLEIRTFFVAYKKSLDDVQ